MFINKFLSFIKIINKNLIIVILFSIVILLISALIFLYLSTNVNLAENAVQISDLNKKLLISEETVAELRRELRFVKATEGKHLTYLERSLCERKSRFIPWY